MSFRLLYFVFVILFVFSYSAYAESSPGNHASFQITNSSIEINSTTKEGQVQSVHLSKVSLLFDVVGHTDQSGNLLSFSIQRKPELQNMYKGLEIHKGSNDAVFIYPSFTQAAYKHGGFYDYYRKNCDTSCLTVQIPSKVDGFQSSSIIGAWVLKSTQLLLCKRPRC